MDVPLRTRHYRPTVLLGQWFSHARTHLCGQDIPRIYTVCMRFVWPAARLKHGVGYRVNGTMFLQKMVPNALLLAFSAACRPVDVPLS